MKETELFLENGVPKVEVTKFLNKIVDDVVKFYEDNALRMDIPDVVMLQRCINLGIENATSTIITRKRLKIEIEKKKKLV